MSGWKAPTSPNRSSTSPAAPASCRGYQHRRAYRLRILLTWRACRLAGITGACRSSTSPAVPASAWLRIDTPCQSSSTPAAPDGAASRASTPPRRSSTSPSATASAASRASPLPRRSFTTPAALASAFVGNSIAEPIVYDASRTGQCFFEGINTDELAVYDSSSPSQCCFEDTRFWYCDVGCRGLGLARSAVTDASAPGARHQHRRAVRLRVQLPRQVLLRGNQHRRADRTTPAAPASAARG
mmetsp:Transcript_128994/g.345996  ORF Transcript_128994/g.345996 Transcript_128994/m.345996 type:complete len:242 (+) Transcript_128994:165-890(+)